MVGAIVARTWHLLGDVAQAIWLHHDFGCLTDSADPTVRRLVALGALADFGAPARGRAPFARMAAAWRVLCLAFLQVTQDELNHWIDTLYPALEAVAL